MNYSLVYTSVIDLISLPLFNFRDHRRKLDGIADFTQDLDN